MAEETLFQKMMKGEIPADFVHEDDHCIAIRDINPQAPTHILVIPRKPITNVASAEPGDAELLGHLLLVCRQVAEADGLMPGGFRVVANNGPDSGQSVDHLHFHVLGGRNLGWPPG
ncbi:MAG: histidine triad nucleotide-binding protein [Dehalococcoidia bacterium]|nr:histidine triad nucleotide-binding protein [Dehalococcoidia bacterium]